MWADGAKVPRGIDYVATTLQEPGPFPVRDTGNAMRPPTLRHAVHALVTCDHQGANGRACSRCGARRLRDPAGWALPVLVAYVKRALHDSELLTGDDM